MPPHAHPATLALLAALSVTLAPRSASSSVAAQAGHAASRTTEPHLFAPGVVSTGDNEFSTALTPDGRTVFWTVSAPDRLRHPFAILAAHRTADGWSDPEVVPFSGGPHSDADPFVSPDGSRLFFMSRRPLAGEASRPDFDLWVVERTAAGWSEPVHLASPVNSDAQEIFPSVAASGTLYFVSDRPGGRGENDLYRARWSAGAYGPPENLKDVNSELGESNVCVAPDESFLIFSSARPTGLGDSDLYLSFRRGAGWSTPRNLGPAVNSDADDYAPALSPDGRDLYFSSRRTRFPARTPGERLTYAELRSRIRHAGNGNADVYVVPIETLLQELRAPAS